MENHPKEDAAVGLSLALAFIIGGIVIPFFFDLTGWTIWSSTVLISIGICGVCFEAGELPRGEGFADIGMGVLFFLPSLLALLQFSNVIVKGIAILGLVFGVFGMLNGVITQYKVRQHAWNQAQEKSEELEMEPYGASGQLWLETLVTLSGFVLNVLAIISYIKELFS